MQAIPEAALTVPEFARALKVGERTVRGWISAGRVRVVRLGRCVRIPPDELRRALAEGV